MESVVINKQFWLDKRVLITGHTGFKGSWLSLWLSERGANITGCSLAPPSTPNLFDVAEVSKRIEHVECDIRDIRKLKKLFAEVQPEIVFHLAAQSLVRQSYDQPVSTYETNVMGTLNVLEAVKLVGTVRSCIVVTSDKCYENKESVQPYQEVDVLGGYDPYSSSKACTEIVTASYRQSYFNTDKFFQHKTALATARAGNVIGGGDWGSDRLIPDIMKALAQGQDVNLRNPGAVRPWQHVLEPLHGYITLAEKLYSSGVEFAEAWNFGPDNSGVISVRDIVGSLIECWGGHTSWQEDLSEQPHEAGLLFLDSNKARQKLDWSPRWNISQTLASIVDWHKAYIADKNMQQLCLSQIANFEATGA